MSLWWGIDDGNTYNRKERVKYYSEKVVAVDVTWEKKKEKNFRDMSPRQCILLERQS